MNNNQIQISECCDCLVEWEFQQHVKSEIVYFLFTLQECDDVSDEKNCQTIFIDPNKYLKSKPPPSIEKDTKLPITLRFLLNV